MQLNPKIAQIPIASNVEQIKANAPNAPVFTHCMKEVANSNVLLHFMRPSIRSRNLHAYRMLCLKKDHASSDAPNVKTKCAFHVLQVTFCLSLLWELLVSSKPPH